MNIPDFPRSIYLGDRCCNSISLDGETEIVKIQADLILKSHEGSRNYYSDGDIESGFLLFTDAEDLEFSPHGLIPNDVFVIFSAAPAGRGRDRYLVVFHIDSMSPKSSPGRAPVSHNVEIRFTAKSMFLEDPRNPGRWISE